MELNISTYVVSQASFFLPLLKKNKKMKLSKFDNVDISDSWTWLAPSSLRSLNVFLTTLRKHFYWTSSLRERKVHSGLYFCAVIVS